MNASLWQIENVTKLSRRSIAGWGFLSASLVRRNLDVDELTLSGTVADVYADPVFNFGDEIVLWRGAVRWWVGWVTQLPAFGSAPSEVRTFVASGAWWWLQQTIYQQPRTVWMNEGVDEAAEKTTVTVLQRASDGSAINMADQVEVGLQYAIDQGAPIEIGPLALAQYAPLDEARDLTCAELVRRALRWSPDSVGWWEYSTSTPTFRLDRRANLSTADIALPPGDSVVSEFSVRPRYDLKVNRVLLIYERTGVRDDDTQFNFLTTDVAGTGGDGFGCFVATVRLGFVNDEPEPLPTGLAAALLAAIGTLQWEGEVVAIEDDCSGLAEPGRVLNLANGRVEWDTMSATVQEVVEELLTGRTRINFGPATHLGVDELIAILRQARSRQADTGVADSLGGGSPPAGGSSGGLGGQAVTLQLCGGGEVRVLKAP